MDKLLIKQLIQKTALGKLKWERRTNDVGQMYYYNRKMGVSVSPWTIRVGNSVVYTINTEKDMLVELLCETIVDAIKIQEIVGGNIGADYCDDTVQLLAKTLKALEVL